MNLFEIWGNSEKIIYLISNEQGQIPRLGIKKQATPSSTKVMNALENGVINIENEDDLDEFIKDLQYIQENRYVGLNILNVNNEKNTIEFRIPNGTINPDTWIENTRLFGRIIQISQRLAEIEEKTISEHSEEDRNLLELKNSLKKEMPENEKLEVLLKLLFSKEEREIYRKRYNTNSKILEQMPDEENPFGQLEFGIVDFERLHNINEFYDVAVNERMDNIRETMEETAKGIRTEDYSQKANEKN